MMTVSELRKGLIDLGQENNIVVNSESGNYAYILDNNIIPTSDQDRRMVVFISLHTDFKKFVMDRDEFYKLFTPALGDDNAIFMLMEYFKKCKNG